MPFNNRRSLSEARQRAFEATNRARQVTTATAERIRRIREATSIDIQVPEVTVHEPEPVIEPVMEPEPETVTTHTHSFNSTWSYWIDDELARRIRGAGAPEPEDDSEVEETDEYDPGDEDRTSEQMPLEEEVIRAGTISSRTLFEGFGSGLFGLNRNARTSGNNFAPLQEPVLTQAQIEDPEGNPMRNTIGHLLGIETPLQLAQTHPMIIGTDLVGIEIELENAPLLDMQYWNTTEDGSLRNGREYVMKQPLGGESLRQAILEVDRRLAGANVDPSWRCSTHGHFNMLNKTVPVLKKILLTHIALEPVMYQCSGWHRWNNIFCPAFGFAKHQLIELSKIWHLEGLDFLSALRNTGVKYSGLNVLPLFTQGSLEFRGSEPKYERGNLFRFVNRFLSIMKFAEEWQGDENSMIAHIQGSAVSSILQRSLPVRFQIERNLLDHSIINAYDVINLGEYKRIGPNTTVSCANRNSWRDYFGRQMPETITLGELEALVRGYRPENYRGELDSWTNEDGQRVTEEPPRNIAARWFIARTSLSNAREYFNTVRGVNY